MNFYKDITIIIVSYKSEKMIIRNLEIIKKLRFSGKSKKLAKELFDSL